MALSDEALVEVADARLYLGLEADDNPSDEWFEQVVSGVSARIQGYTGRKYRPFGSAGETRVFSHDTTEVLEIDDCSAVTLVEVASSPAADEWTELGSEDYVVEPLNETQKTSIRFLNNIEGVPMQNVGWEGLGLHTGSSRTPWPSESRAASRAFVAVRVTATYGFEDVPSHIQLAAVMWIQNLVKRDVAFFSADLASATVAQGEMPPDVKGILDGERLERASVASI